MSLIVKEGGMTEQRNASATSKKTAPGPYQ